MYRTSKIALLLAAACAAAACSDQTGPSQFSSVNAGFASLLTGFGNTLNSFNASADSMQPWGPGPHGDHHGGMMGGGMMGGHHDGDFDHGPGFGGPGFGMDGGMMGGGLGDLFRGMGFGAGFGHGHHGDEAFSNCTFNSATNRLDCATDTEHGLTITRSIQLKDANGNIQQKFDSLTTNSINEQVAVSGTVTRRDGATSTVSHNSDRTVSGLAHASTQRTVNGTSQGTENTVGTDSAGAFTIQRTAGDTTKNVVVPVPTSTSTTPPYPISGTIIRSMKVVQTHAGTTTTSTRREVVTYDGSATAKVQITQDGTTKSCTVALPHGRLTCS